MVINVKLVIIFPFPIFFFVNTLANMDCAYFPHLIMDNQSHFQISQDLLYVLRYYFFFFKVT